MLMREHLSEYQEGLLKAEADKINLVLTYMRGEGFASIRQFLGAVFSNSHLKSTQTQFFQTGLPTGIDQILNQWLKDKRVAPGEGSRLHSVEDWVCNLANNEFENLLDEKKNSCLRHMAQSSVESGFQASRLEDLLDEVKMKAPFLWRLFLMLGSKKIKSNEVIEAKDMGLRAKNVSLMSLLNLLYARNQQANGIQSLMAVYYKAEGTYKRAMETMHKSGYIISYSEIQRTLNEIAQNLDAQLRAYARAQSLMISVANVNQMIRATETQLDHKSYIDNSTAGYARLIVGLPPGECIVQRRWLNRGRRLEMCSMDLNPGDECAIRVMEVSHVNCAIVDSW